MYDFIPFAAGHYRKFYQNKLNKNGSDLVTIEFSRWKKKIAKQRRKFPIQRLQKLSDVQEINNQSFQIDT